MKMASASIGLRLGAGFGAILVLFGVAMLVVMSALAQIGEAEREMVLADHAKHAGHMVAFQIRDQHLRQAHAIIARLSAPEDYAGSVEAARTAILELASFARSSDEREAVAEIARLAAATDAEFRIEVLPIVETAPAARLAAAHRALLEAVERVIDLNDRLGSVFEERSAAAQDRAEQLRGAVKLVTTGCFGFALLAAAVLGLLVVRSISKPIAALEAGARRIAGGDLSTRIATGGGKELAGLAASFNDMAAELRRHQEALLRNGRLASIGQVAAGVAHEINNPLGVILGYATMLSRSAASEQQKSELDIIAAEARQCQHIVHDLLNLARPQQHEATLVDLAEVAAEARARLSESGAVDERSLTVALEGAPLHVWADESKLRQVLDNLLANALDATPPGGRIEIAGRRDNGSVTLSVRDSGSGIAAEVMPRLFEPFFTTKKHGTGLGLAICQAILDAHSGTIEAASPPGGGAVFTVRLPATHPAGRAS